MDYCVCGHEVDDHESVGEGMLPLCFFCGCLGPIAEKTLPPWMRKIREDRRASE